MQQDIKNHPWKNVQRGTAAGIVDADALLLAFPQGTGIRLRQHGHSRFMPGFADFVVVFVEMIDFPLADIFVFTFWPGRI
jgi:hypothetical protein